MMMAIGKPDMLLIALSDAIKKMPTKVLFAFGSEHCYMKVAELTEDIESEEYSKEFCEGLKAGYEMETNIPFENAIVKYELEDGMLKDHEWSFISDTDSSLQSLTLDWHSRAELGIENVPQLQNGVF